jgi:hypothetical protein
VRMQRATAERRRRQARKPELERPEDIRAKHRIPDCSKPP